MLRRIFVSYRFFFIAFGICLIYFSLTGARPLNNPDESRYSEIAREMIVSGDYITPRFNGVLFLDKPPVYYWLQAASIKIWGLTTASLRFFPALFALLGAFLCYQTARVFFGKTAALYAALILISSPLYFFIGLYANLDMEVAVFITASLLFFMQALLEHPVGRSRNVLLFLSYLSAGLGFLTKGLIALVFPTLIIGLWVLVLRRWQVLKEMHLIPGLLLMAAINIPWFYLEYLAHPNFLHFFFYEQQFTRFIGSEFNGHNPFYFYAGLIIAGTFPWSVFLLPVLKFHAKKNMSAGENKPELVFLYLWFIVIVVFFSIPQSKLASYIIPALPPLALLMGHFLAKAVTSDKSGYVGRCALFNLGLYIALFVGLILSLVCLISPYFIADLQVPIAMYYSSLGCVAMTLGVSIFLLTKRRDFIVQGYFVGAFIFCIAATYSVPYWIEHVADKRPTEASTVYLSEIIKKHPDAQLYSYKTFYYDLPILLQKPLKVVFNWSSPELEREDSWTGKFAWGAMYETSAKAILINQDDFRQVWDSPKSIVVITNKMYLSEFSHANIVAKYKANVLISNH